MKPSWTGPKGQNEEELAIYIRLEIRRIKEWSTRLSQEAAKSILHSFRNRLTIKLLYGRIKPSDENM